MSDTHYSRVRLVDVIPVNVLYRKVVLTLCGLRIGAGVRRPSHAGGLIEAASSGGISVRRVHFFDEPSSVATCTACVLLKFVEEHEWHND